jgi:hypothetical protein
MLTKIILEPRFGDDGASHFQIVDRAKAFRADPAIGFETELDHHTDLS